MTRFLMRDLGKGLELPIPCSSVELFVLLLLGCPPPAFWASRRAWGAVPQIAAVALAAKVEGWPDLASAPVAEQRSLSEWPGQVWTLSYAQPPREPRWHACLLSSSGHKDDQEFHHGENQCDRTDYPKRHTRHGEPASRPATWRGTHIPDAHHTHIHGHGT